MYYVDGIGEIKLEKNDFVNSGGEGNIYIKNNIAFKIYHDPKRMISLKKIKELSEMTMDNIIKPEKIIYDENKNVVGYTMKVINEYYPLSRLITTDFRQQHNINNDKILNLILIMRKTIQHIHEKGCCFVDANEMNFLVSKNFDEVYFIDVDSYKTKTYPPTAYTEIALDPHVNLKNNNSFTSASDWYAFAILACKLFVGIHPFKGKFKNKNKKMSINERMLKGISIFNSEVSIPKTARDVNKIPKNYLSWFINIFEKGERTIAPESIHSDYYNLKENMIVRDILNIIKIKDYKENINYISTFDNNLFIKSGSSVYFNDDKFEVQDIENTYPYYSFKNGLLLLKLNNDGKVVIYKTKTKEIIETDVFIDSLYIHNNNILGNYNNELYEIEVFETLNNLKLIKSNQTSIYQKSFNRINNVYINKMFEKNIILFQITNGSIYKETFLDLDGYSVTDAKFQRGILGISFYKNGETISRFYRFNKNYTNKELLVEYVDTPLDFTVSDKGILIINNKDSLILMLNEYLNNMKKEIKDNNLENLTLYSNDSDIFAISNKSLYTISMN